MTISKIILIVIIMSTINWGLLAKSAVDAETIEEAIARLIQAHDDDETAHLDTGQALQSHKVSEIVDHLARSIVRDKLKFDRFTIDEHFASIDAWGKTAGVTLDNYGCVNLTTTAMSGNERSFYLTVGDVMSGQGAKEQNPIWETRVKLAQTTAQTIYIIQGDKDIPTGLGFKIVNGTLYTVYWDSTDTEQTQEITGITLTNANTFRVEVSNGVSVKWYVNDVLKKTLTTGLPTGYDIFMNYVITTNANAAKTMYVVSLHWDADFVN